MDEAPDRRALAAPAGDAPAGSPAAWCAAVAVVAVAAAVDPWGFRPFTTARWAVVGVAVAAAAAVAGAARRRARAPLPRPLVLAGVGLLVCLAVATATALDPLTALLGHPRRHLGLLGWVVSALAFVAGTRLTAGEVRRHLGRAGVVAAGITGVASLADLAGWDPAGSHVRRRADRRAARPAGVPGRRDRAARPARGGGGGRPVGRVGGGAGRPRARRWRAPSPSSPRRRGVRGSGAALAAAVAWPRVVPPVRAWLTARPRAVIAGLALAAVLAFVPFGARAAAGLDPDAAGGRGRVDDWVVAVRVIAAHPVTGVGPEGYRIAAPAHVDDGYARRHGRDEVLDRAHNGPLDVAVSAGIPAAALYVALLGGVVACSVRVLRRSTDPVVAGAAAGVVAWVGQQMVGFPIAEVDPVAWLLAGAVVVAACGLAPPPRAPRAERRGRSAGSPPGPPPRWSRSPAGRAWPPIETCGPRERATDDRAPAAAVAAADRATARRPDDVDAWYVAARVASAPAGLPAVDAGLDRVEEGLTWSPDDPALRALHTDLLVERALRSGLPDDLAAAERAARDRTVADPSGPRAHRQLGLVLATAGRPAQARAELARALALDPDDPVAEQALADIDEATAGSPSEEGDR